MELLYLSALASSRVIEEARKFNPSFGNYAVHKFNRLVVEGLCSNDAKVTSLSSFFMDGKWFWKHKHEIINGVEYRYIPSINIGFIRHIGLFLYCFFYVIIWGVVKRRNKAIICDVLNASMCLGAVWATKIIGIRSVGIMTDMPGVMIDRSDVEEQVFFREIYRRFCFLYLHRFSHYVFLTEQMNNVVNIKNRPFVVIEGMVDKNSTISSDNDVVSAPKRIIIYAGGLMERYGLKKLVEAFMHLKYQDIELWLYGNGSFAEVLSEYEQRDSRIHYWGVQPNSIIMEAEYRATLLVNPRPTNEEFTQYSFPSKNMEYMVSGTPVLTTILPGMPHEYYPFVYLFDKGETVEGYTESLDYLLNLPPDELKEKGKIARKWVLENKNNTTQTAQILKLLSIE